MKEMERKHLCEMLVLERLISEEKESDLRKATQQLTKEQQQERLFELKVGVLCVRDCLPFHAKPLGQLCTLSFYRVINRQGKWR